MTDVSIETDYLVVGAGATAMAFVDTLLGENPEATIAMVDRQHRPGGHWNDAYPFVRLHQPSEWYGVASRELGHGIKDTGGFNSGLYGLASGPQVLAYFDQVMQERFLPSGRMRWMPMSQYAAGPGGEHRVTSLTSGEAQTINVRRKVVDATHARTTVPSTSPPKYEVAEGVTCAPLNKLPQIKRPHAGYTVVGSGKTGMDAILWLLENGVTPVANPLDHVAGRLADEPGQRSAGIENYERSIGSIIGQLDAICAAPSVPALFARLEDKELLLRIDKSVEPTTYRCAVVSPAELAQLRRIEDIVRLGRVRRVEPAQIILEKGAVSAEVDTLYIDCSASAIVMPPDLPVFDGDHRINLLMVRTCPTAVQCGGDRLRGEPPRQQRREERAVRRCAQPRKADRLVAHVAGKPGQWCALAPAPRPDCMAQLLPLERIRRFHAWREGRRHREDRAGAGGGRQVRPRGGKAVRHAGGECMSRKDEL
jgi:hypothetical protein